MRFTIVGAGALGSILGAHLIKAGHEVHLVARGRRLAWLLEHGLQVYGLSDLQLPCSASAAIGPLGDEDILVFAVKTYHMETALAACTAGRPRAVFSLANGVLKNDQLRTVFPPERVLGCMANFSGELESDGRVLFTRNVAVVLGGEEPLATDLAATIDASGVVAASSQTIETVEWSKFVGWAALFSLAVTTRAATGAYLSDRRCAAVGVRIVRECAAIAAARGIALLDQSPLPVLSLAQQSETDAIDTLQGVGRELIRNAPRHRMSALQDVEAGRRLEVHETLGYLVNAAAELGLAAPTLNTAYQLCGGIDALSGPTDG